MSESGYTRGPWMAAARPSSVVGWPVVAPADMGRSVCNVTVGHDQSEANARLIAAAPDMLEALKDAERFIACISGNGETDYRAKMKAIIAKAEGKS